MGFLKKLFEKKDCEICGGEIGLLGNTKLADGDLCKTCKEKLSPLFRIKDDTTVADIKEQLAYREENKKALDAFRPDEEFGTSDKILVDTAAKKYFGVNVEDLTLSECAALAALPQAPGDRHPL